MTSDWRPSYVIWRSLGVWNKDSKAHIVSIDIDKTMCGAKIPQLFIETVVVNSDGIVRLPQAMAGVDLNPRICKKCEKTRHL